MKDLDYYESLPYRAVWEHAVTADGDWYWRVSLHEIPAVVGLGTTEDEALEELRERFEEYVRFRIDEGLDIPEPEVTGIPDAAADGARHGGYGRGPGGNRSQRGDGGSR